MRRQTVHGVALIPWDFKIDWEFGCLTAAEQLETRCASNLQYVEGRTRFPKEKWGAHAWCRTPEGVIVDPYFYQLFPNGWKDIEYVEDTNAFEHI